jgi:peptidoglycan-associated lipoprotein
MFKTMLTACAVAAALAGCASGVKLDEVPVENRSGTAVQPGGADAAAGGRPTESAVTAVQTGERPGDTMGPANLARIVYFDYDSDAIRSEFQKANQSRKVVIEGSTDERGGREYNLALGQRRAEAVRRSLGLLGIGDNQVEAVSFGKEKPAVQGGDEAAWAQNRRAEIAYR